MERRIRNLEEARKKFTQIFKDPEKIEKVFMYNIELKERAFQEFKNRLNRDKELSEKFLKKPTDTLKEFGLLGPLDKVTVEYPREVASWVTRSDILCFWEFLGYYEIRWEPYLPSPLPPGPLPPDMPEIGFPEIVVFPIFRLNCRPIVLGTKCVRICVKIIQGATTDVDRDFRVANEIYDQCGIDIVKVCEETNDEPYLLDLDQPSCYAGQTPTTEEDDLYDLMREDCPAEIVAYYVRSTNMAVRGCAAYPSGRPGFVVCDSATKFTFAHELGHVLGLRHVNDNTNLMTGNGTSSINRDPPNLTSDQCETVNSSEFIEYCLRRARLREEIRVAVLAREAKVIGGRLRTLLLEDEFTGLEEILKIGKNAVPKLIEIMKEDSDPVVRRRAAIVLGRIGDKRAIVPLKLMLEDSDPVHRYTAVDALGLIGDRKVVKDITRLLTDDDPSVRRSAVVALGKLRDKKSIENLKKIVKEEKYDFIKKKAEEAIRNIEKK